MHQNENIRNYSPIKYIPVKKQKISDRKMLKRIVVYQKYLLTSECVITRQNDVVIQEFPVDN